MRIKGLTDDQLRRALPRGMTFNRFERRGAWVHFRLKLRSSRDVYHRHGFYQERRLINVCWHGHRAFMRQAFASAPDAVLVSAFARYDGREHFERTHDATGDRNIGSQMQPRMMREACDCERSECPSQTKRRRYVPVAERTLRAMA